MADSASTALTCSCPECETRFRVTQEQLAVANGRVRCGACLTVFDLNHLVQGPADNAVPVPDEEPGTVADRDIGPIEAQRVATPPARERARPTRSAAIGMFALGYVVAGILLAALVLGLQYPAWSQEPAYRPVYQAACAIAPCELALLRDIAAIEVNPGPPVRAPGPPPELAVTVELANGAAFRQPFPTLVLRTADSDNRTLTEHQLAPLDYLRDGHTRQMSRDATTTVELRVPDPGEHAVSYALSLL